MTIAARYSNEERTTVVAVIDGVEWHGVRLDQSGEIPDKVNAWLAAGNQPDAYVPRPPLPVLIPYAEFRLRFTSAEREALHGACKASWQIDDFVRLAAAEGQVNLSGAVAPLAKEAFVSAGVLTAKRAEDIFQ